MQSNFFKVNFEALLRLNPADNSLDSAAMDGRRAKSMSLLDLDQNLIVNILSRLSIQDKLRLQVTCKDFDNIMGDPAPGSGIWGVIELHELNCEAKLSDLYRPVPCNSLYSLICGEPTSEIAPRSVS